MHLLPLFTMIFVCYALLYAMLCSIILIVILAKLFSKLSYECIVVEYFALIQFLRVIHAYFLKHGLQFDMQLPCNGYWLFNTC